MKKIILLLLVLATTAGFAQENIKKENTPETEAKEITAKMKAQLNLSAEQEERVYGLYLSKAKSKAKKKNDKSRAASTMQKEADKIDKESFKAEIRAILTKEQYGRWLATEESTKEENTKKEKKLKVN